MARVREIVDYTKKLSGHKLNVDEGVQFGSGEAEVRKVLVCWMATEGALERAGKIEADLVIGHESLYFPYDAAVRTDNPPGWENWAVNRKRRELLSQYNLTFLRIHGSADEISIFEAFRRQLGLPEASADGGRYNYKRFDIDPISLRELAEVVKAAMNMDHLRISAPKGLDQKVSKAGLLWGGVGLFVNVINQAELMELGCDVFIAGETDDYGMRFSRDQGIPMIETSHEISENAGLKQFVDILAGQFPGVDFDFYENKCPWTVY